MRAMSEWLADWPCYHAEKDRGLRLRPWSTRETSWVDWHKARFARTADMADLERADRHTEPVHMPVPDG